MKKKFLNSSTIHPRSISQARRKKKKTVGGKYGKTCFTEKREQRKTKKKNKKNKKQKKKGKKEEKKKDISRT